VVSCALVCSPFVPRPSLRPRRAALPGQRCLILWRSKIDSVLQEDGDDDFGGQAEMTHFCDQVRAPNAQRFRISLTRVQFERLLLETDITVGVARRVLEKRHDLKNRAFNDLKRDAESKCVEAVGLRSAAC
jgi:hypothetical protein